MTAGALLDVQGLRKAFGGVRAVDGVDLQVRAGAIHALIGPNGAGKSTFFNLLTGGIRPDAGRVLVEGTDVTGLQPHVITRLGVARSFQRASIFPKLSVSDNVRVAVLVREHKTYSLHPLRVGTGGDAVRALVAEVGLAEHVDRAADLLSHGDKKRLELAIALANRPRLLLLDEPTAGMSPDETRGTITLVARLARERGVTVLFTEHDMGVVFGIAERVTVLHQGRVVAEGAGAAIRDNVEVQRIYLGDPAWSSS